MFVTHYNTRTSNKFWKEEIEVNIDQIVKFGITNRRAITKQGNFKKFNKYYYIVVNQNGENAWFNNISEFDFKEIKLLLKGKYTLNKHTEIEYKNGKERKATDWEYTVKKEI